jgi:translation initiation factor IF-2
METSERLNRVRYLRAQFGMNARLRLELHAAVSRLLREHNIHVEDEVLRYLVPADEEEFAPISFVATPCPAPKPTAPPTPTPSAPRPTPAPPPTAPAPAPPKAAAPSPEAARDSPAPGSEPRRGNP